MFLKRIVVTGGAGFIGSHVVRRFVTNYPDYQIINLDKLTYAGNLANLKDIENKANYVFERADILDAKAIQMILERYQVTDIIHLAAESHVDRSITDPLAFVNTNVIGTVTLLNESKSFWKSDLMNHRFYHVSTDEVYGSLGETGFFTESTKYDPHSPYSASKASSDHFVRAYADTYGMNTVISNCSNNYGPFHFPEKLIPLIINNIKNRKPLPIYGKGENIRDWLYVEDHAAAIDLVFHKGKLSETYNIGGHNEWKNIDVVKLLCKIMDQELHRNSGDSETLITYVTDRLGHDMRYAIDATKIKNELGWMPLVKFEDAIRTTVKWYLSNEDWLQNVTSGAYQSYYESQYR